MCPLSCPRVFNQVDVIERCDRPACMLTRLHFCPSASLHAFPCSAMSIFWLVQNIHFIRLQVHGPLCCCQRPDPGETTERDTGSISVHVHIVPRLSMRFHTLHGVSTFSLVPSPHFDRYSRRFPCSIVSTSHRTPEITCAVPNPPDLSRPG